MKKSRPRLCLQSLTLLQDNVPAHTSKGTLTFLEKRLDNPPAPTLSTRFSPMLLFLASTSEKTLEGRRYHSRQAVGEAVFQCLKDHRVASTPKLATNFIDYKQMTGMTTVRKSCYYTVLSRRYALRWIYFYLNIFIFEIYTQQ